MLIRDESLVARTQPFPGSKRNPPHILL